MQPRLNVSLVQFTTVSVLTGSRTKHRERLTECRSGVEIPAADDTLTLCRGRGEKTLARPPYNRRASLVPPNRAALINYTPQATHNPSYATSHCRQRTTIRNLLRTRPFSFIFWSQPTRGFFVWYWQTASISSNVYEHRWKKSCQCMVRVTIFQ